MGFFTKCFLAGNAHKATKDSSNNPKQSLSIVAEVLPPRTAVGPPSGIVGKEGIHAQKLHIAKEQDEQFRGQSKDGSGGIGVSAEEKHAVLQDAIAVESPPCGVSPVASQAQQQLRDAMVLASSPATITVVTHDGIVLHQNPQSKLYLGERDTVDDEDVLGLIFSLEPAKRIRMMEELSRAGGTGVWKAVVRVPPTLNRQPTDAVSICLSNVEMAAADCSPDFLDGHTYVSHSGVNSNLQHGERLTPASTTGGGWPFGAEGRSTLAADFLSNDDLRLSSGMPSSTYRPKRVVATATGIIAPPSALGAASGVPSPNVTGLRQGDSLTMATTEGPASLMLAGGSNSTMGSHPLARGCTVASTAASAAVPAAGAVEQSEPSWLCRQRARTATGITAAGGGHHNPRRLDSFTLSAGGGTATGVAALRAGSSRLLLAAPVGRVDSNNRMGSFNVSGSFDQTVGGTNSFVQDPLATSTFATLVGSAPVPVPPPPNNAAARSLPAPVVPSAAHSRGPDGAASISATGSEASAAAAAVAAAAAANAPAGCPSQRRLPRRTASCISANVNSDGTLGQGPPSQRTGIPSMPAPAPNASRALAFALSLGTSPLLQQQQQQITAAQPSPRGRVPVVGLRPASSTATGHFMLNTCHSGLPSASAAVASLNPRRNTMSFDYGGRALLAPRGAPLGGLSATMEPAFASECWVENAAGECADNLNHCVGGGPCKAGVDSVGVTGYGSFNGGRNCAINGNGVEDSNRSLGSIGASSGNHRLRPHSAFPRFNSFIHHVRPSMSMMGMQQQQLQHQKLQQQQQHSVGAPAAAATAAASSTADLGAAAGLPPPTASEGKEVMHESEMQSPFTCGPHLGTGLSSGGGVGVRMSLLKALAFDEDAEVATVPGLSPSDAMPTATASGTDAGSAVGSKQPSQQHCERSTGDGGASTGAAATAAAALEVGSAVAAASQQGSKKQLQLPEQQLLLLPQTQSQRCLAQQMSLAQQKSFTKQQSLPQQPSQGRVTDPSPAAAVEPECWHEMWATAAQDPVSQRDVIILTQTDVTAKVIAERHLALVMETEHRLVEQLFPRHILQYITEEWTSNSAAVNAMTGSAAASAPDGAHAGGGAGAEGHKAAGAGAPPTSGRGQRWRPVVRDCNALATWHPEVTLLFADIKGFTPLCKEVEPRQVMALLNALYSRFDAMLDTFGVYKVETIGDCYFVAGGLICEDEDGMAAVRDCGSKEDPLHAERVFMFARAMLAAAREVPIPTNGEPVEIRIGIHTGPVVSGVVGTRMPRFCLFGDTVNTASRMESTGVPGAIHASQATYARLQRNEQWQPTGGIEVKGKGLMQTFLWRPAHAEEAPSLCYLDAGGSEDPQVQAPASFAGLGLEPVQEVPSPLQLPEHHNEGSTQQGPGDDASGAPDNSVTSNPKGSGFVNFFERLSFDGFGIARPEGAPSAGAGAADGENAVIEMV
ncbi:hypothetical protein Agub_g15300 [Astrephomene gubernaculifera]|uniref:Guanylate cyclase domain-containing protein n=1 Tax=Astrephomene gubernaculifera TaxID=47775 RepID=A0AAD3E2U1_9CHLO|nr:hypothetical protein Agub_g15300 [Astrephomene gubernaculifera]